MNLTSAFSKAAGAASNWTETVHFDKSVRRCAGNLARPVILIAGGEGGHRKSDPRPRTRFLGCSRNGMVCTFFSGLLEPNVHEIAAASTREVNPTNEP